MMSRGLKSRTSRSSSDSAVSSATMRRREFGRMSGFTSFWLSSALRTVRSQKSRTKMGPLIETGEAQWTHVVSGSVNALA